MTPEEELNRAAEAEEILSRPVFKESVKAIEEALLMGIRSTAFKDAELREKLCHRYALLHDLLGQLKTHMETGRLAEETLKQRRRGAPR